MSFHNQLSAQQGMLAAAVQSCSNSYGIGTASLGCGDSRLTATERELNYLAEAASMMVAIVQELEVRFSPALDGGIQSDSAVQKSAPEIPAAHCSISRSIATETERLRACHLQLRSIISRCEI